MSSQDENSSDTNVVNTNPKTQEFNTITSSNSTTVEGNFLNYTGSFTGSFPSSLPFFINPDTQTFSNTFAANAQVPPATTAFIYQPVIPFTATPEQVQQYLYMMQQRQPQSRTPSTNSSKRVKLSANTLTEQLNDFKDTLKSSFEKNLQKLEVLDRMVQTVTAKGNFHVGNVKNAMEILSNSRELLKQMIAEQVNFTACLTLELQTNLKQELKSVLTSFSFVVDSSKTELVDKLRKEEDSHLTDLTILSSRNKELQKESKAVKEQLEKLQQEYAEALKTSFKDKEEHLTFKQSILEVLKQKEETDSSCVISSIEDLLKENEELKTTLNTNHCDIKNIIEQFHNIKEDVKNNYHSEPVNYDDIGTVFVECTDELYKRFEEVLYFRERFYNSKIEELKGKIENLIFLQSNLTHQSLNMKIGLQRQLADSIENMTRLRRHCQELTANLNEAANELDKKRLISQAKESENMELKRKTEILNEKLKTLEQELSVKNQENRTLSIRIQGLQSELEENSIKHRHDISALERKISILESKQLKKEEIVIDMDDPFSSLGRRESIVEEEVSVVIPPTAPVTVVPLAVQKNVIITFTGIRDSQKQKELSKWLEELGATVHVGADFNDDITHVLAPKGYRSIRVLAASLTGKWIVPCEWVEACHRTNQFVSENLHGGFLNTSIRPFRFRTIWLSSAFAATHKAHPIYPVAALKVLLEKLGKARWCESAGQADFLLVTDEEKDSKLIGSSRGVLLTLNNLINMIPIE